MKQVSRILFFILIGELILGGGGRLTAFGPVSLRMILFSFAMIITAIFFFQGRRMSRTIALYLLAFLAVLSVGLLIGLLSGAKREFWIEDVKPLSYVLILPFFYFVVEDHRDMKTVSGLIVNSALLLSVLFFAVLALIHTNIVPFQSFYSMVIDSGEFFFRAETTFFYKGFIYLCIALIFVFFVKQKFQSLIISILIVAIILTFTRGFIFALALTYIFYALLEKKYSHVVVALTLTALLIFSGKQLIYNLSSGIHQLKDLDESVPKDRLLGNRDESDSGRIQQAKEVFSEITPLSFFVGHGFGNGVVSRPVHMEVSYLEIFHKQGILGLAIWLWLFHLLFIRYRNSGKDVYTRAFYFSACFLFFQSLTNQFINNPIGLSFALLSLAYLHLESSKWLIIEHQKRNHPRHQKGDEISITSF